MRKTDSNGVKEIDAHNGDKEEDAQCQRSKTHSEIDKEKDA